jgi:hypothetical protein
VQSELSAADSVRLLKEGFSESDFPQLEERNSVLHRNIVPETVSFLCFGARIECLKGEGNERIND